MKNVLKKIALGIKNVYLKIAPIVSKISLIGLIVSVLALLGSKFYLNHQNSQDVVDAWAVFYGLWAERIATWLVIASAVMQLVFNFRAIWAWLREFLRKTIVSLKRNPSMIPLAMMFITFLYYSLNLTDVSDTTAKIYGKGMGLSQFCIMLFSLLSLVCMLNAFPRRKKANIPMIVLMFVMYGIIIFCDKHYSNMVIAAINRLENPIAITEDTIYIAKANNMLNIHMVLTIVCAALVALLPLYSKLLKKINTSVAIEDNGDMDQIDIQD